jgi:hypothetical protein
MQNRFHAFHGAIDSRGIPHIGDLQLRAIQRFRAASGMYVRSQRIENTHLVPAGKQAAQHMATDESGAAGK